MLVLSRRQMERVAIFDGSGAFAGWVIMADRRAERCAIGFDFPTSWAVLREELLTDEHRAAIADR